MVHHSWKGFGSHSICSAKSTIETFNIDTKNGHTLGIQSSCQRMIGVSNHLVSKVSRFHYHSQRVIGSLGIFKRSHLFQTIILSIQPLVFRVCIFSLLFWRYISSLECTLPHCPCRHPDGTEFELEERVQNVGPILPYII